MLQRLPSYSEVERRERERAEADALYNAALTALDKAVPPPLQPPTAPSSFDEHQVETLNQRWEIVSGSARPPRGRGLRSRLADFVWRVVEPIFERQQAFNSALVDHINRNVPAAQSVTASLASSAQAVSETAAAQASFHTQLILYLQQITLYVDTKDRALAAGFRSVIDALTEEWLRGVESLDARERRLADVRETLVTLQQRTLMMKREIERLAQSGTAAVTSQTPAQGDVGGGADVTAVDSYKYVGFEDLFRGPQAEVRGRQADYVELFRGARDVLDIGCGRGEFLDLLGEAGISARGLDVNRAMVDACRERGLAAEEGDALEYLHSRPDESLGGIFSAQVVEHLPPGYLIRLLETAFHKMRPGGRIVLETINPSCWIAFFESYVRDLTHRQPVHPDTLKYLLRASGFHQLEIRFRSPYPDAEKLQPAAALSLEANQTFRDLADTHNANIARLNSLIFSYLDYAAVGVRP
jgi:SAM-dependent methyltransferase